MRIFAQLMLSGIALFSLVSCNSATGDGANPLSGKADKPIGAQIGGPKGPGNQPVIEVDSSNYVYSPATSTGTNPTNPSATTITVGVEWDVPNFTETSVQHRPDKGSTYTFTYYMMFYPQPTSGPGPTPTPAPTLAGPVTVIPQVSTGVYLALGPVFSAGQISTNNKSEGTFTIPASGGTPNQHDYLVYGTVQYVYTTADGLKHNPTISLAPQVINLTY